MKQIAYSEGYKYQTRETYSDTIPIRPAQDIRTRWCSLSTAGLLTLEEGYASDGPSGPTVDTKSAMRAAFCHDAIYQMIRLGLLDEKWREAADRMYADMFLEDATEIIERDYWEWVQPAAIAAAKARAEIHYRSLRVFGSPAAQADAEPFILRAP